jgi:hypothetical protein
MSHPPQLKLYQHVIVRVEQGHCFTTDTNPCQCMKSPQRGSQAHREHWVDHDCCQAFWHVQVGATQPPSPPPPPLSQSGFDSSQGSASAADASYCGIETTMNVASVPHRSRYSHFVRTTIQPPCLLQRRDRQNLFFNCYGSTKDALECLTFLDTLPPLHVQPVEQVGDRCSARVRTRLQCNSTRLHFPETRANTTNQ